MASREEIESLRALARKRHRAVTQKVSRLKASADVVISGTRLDPRKNPASFKKMNSIQLKAHIARLDTFVSRETSYVRGAGKTVPLNGNLWQTYKRLESAVNKQKESTFEGLKDLFIPSLGVKASEFVAQTPAHPVTGNPSARAPHVQIDRKAVGIPNDKQLKKLIADMKKKLAPEYTDKMIVRDKKILRKFFKDISKVSDSPDLKDIKRDFKDLTPGQFSFLWNYTNFSDAASFDYEIAKNKLNDAKSMSQWDNQFNTQIRHMKTLIGDVKKMQL